MTASHPEPTSALGTKRQISSTSLGGQNRRQGRFHDTFRRAGLDGLYAGDPCRVPVQLSAGSRVWNHTGGSEPARLQVMTALDALGGVQSPGGSCAWYVLGCEMSLRRWSLTANWAARRIDHKIAAGILVADLGILQAHWGL